MPVATLRWPRNSTTSSGEPTFQYPWNRYMYIPVPKFIKTLPTPTNLLGMPSSPSHKLGDFLPAVHSPGRCLPWVGHIGSIATDICNCWVNISEVHWATSEAVDSERQHHTSTSPNCWSWAACDTLCHFPYHVNRCLKVHKYNLYIRWWLDT